MEADSSSGKRAATGAVATPRTSQPGAGWQTIGRGRREFEAPRRRLAERLAASGIRSRRVLDAFAMVPRHLLIPEALRSDAYRNISLPIGDGQTISAPGTVAQMTEALELDGDETVLEIGTGSGYQAAILAEIVKEVYTIEIIQPLAIKARLLLNDLGYKNVHFKHGDGYQGWPEHAPYDAIIVTAAPKEIPQKLIEQLKIKGRLIIPVGDDFQQLFLITKTEDGTEERKLIPVRFVPLVNPNK